MEGEPVDLYSGNLNSGDTIHIFDYLNDKWKKAEAVEIDFTEREILANFEDGSQEWISVDSRKICFPPSGSKNTEDYVSTNNDNESSNTLSVQYSSSFDNGEEEFEQKNAIFDGLDDVFPSPREPSKSMKNLDEISDALDTEQMNMDSEEYAMQSDDTRMELENEDAADTSTEENVYARDLPLSSIDERLNTEDSILPPIVGDVSWDEDEEEEEEENERDSDWSPPQQDPIDDDADNASDDAADPEPVPKPTRARRSGKKRNKDSLKYLPFPKLKIGLFQNSGSRFDIIRRKRERREQLREKLKSIASQPASRIDSDVTTPKKRGKKNTIGKIKIRLGNNSAEIINDDVRKIEKSITPNRYNPILPENSKQIVEGERTSVEIPDNNLPPGWKKHMIQRKVGAKWAVNIISAEGRKFRCRSELRTYFDNRDEPFEEERFNFSLFRPKSGEKTAQMSIPSPAPTVSPSMPTGQKKIKTLLPKRTPPDTPDVASNDAFFHPGFSKSDSSYISTPYSDPFLSGSVGQQKSASPNTFICPKQDCKKQFRRENLLMMHIKHYHSEYTNLLSWAPKVYDLACARIDGASINTGQTGFIERITKLEEDRQKERTDATPPSQNVPAKNEEETIKDTTFESKPSPQEVLEQPCSPHTSKKNAFGDGLAQKMSPSKSQSVLLDQLNQPPLLPPTISIQSENSNEELTISQNRVCNTPIKMPEVKSERGTPDKVDNAESDFSSKPSTPEMKKLASAKKRKVSPTQSDTIEIINCLCGFGYEDGLMVQCDLCLCWQHAACNSYENASEVPPTYVCYFCQYPRRQHSSSKYAYVQNWLKEGKLPCFDFFKPQAEIVIDREQRLKQNHNLMCKLKELNLALHSIQVKIQILRNSPNHPKLYLWAKSWNQNKVEEKENRHVVGGGPVPEAAINMTECKKNLCEHIDMEIDKASVLMQNIELQVDELDKNGTNIDDPASDEVIKQTLLMLVRDLGTIQKLRYCSTPPP